MANSEIVESYSEAKMIQICLSKSYHSQKSVQMSFFLSTDYFITTSAQISWEVSGEENFFFSLWEMSPEWESKTWYGLLHDKRLRYRFWYEVSSPHFTSTISSINFILVLRHHVASPFRSYTLYCNQYSWIRSCCWSNCWSDYRNVVDAVTTPNLSTTMGTPESNSASSVAPVAKTAIFLMVATAVFLM